MKDIAEWRAGETEMCVFRLDGRSSMGRGPGGIRCLTSGEGEQTVGSGRVAYSVFMVCHPSRLVLTMRLVADADFPSDTCSPPIIAPTDPLMLDLTVNFLDI